MTLNKTAKRVPLVRGLKKISLNTIPAEIRRSLNFAKNISNMGIARMRINANLLMEEISYDATIMSIIGTKLSNASVSLKMVAAFMGSVVTFSTTLMTNSNHTHLNG